MRVLLLAAAGIALVTWLLSGCATTCQSCARAAADAHQAWRACLRAEQRLVDVPLCAKQDPPPATELDDSGTIQIGPGGILYDGAIITPNLQACCMCPNACSNGVCTLACCSDDIQFTPGLLQFAPNTNAVPPMDDELDKAIREAAALTDRRFITLENRID